MSDEKEETLDTEIQEDTSRQNIAAYVLIEKKVRKLKYGQSTVTIRIHDSRITDIMFQDFERRRLEGMFES